MNTPPLVSIGAINYNNARFVIETLDSIKQQTYPNIELIIVDDCSTDNSLSLIKEWLKGYTKPYIFIKHEKNLGVCATCNDVLKNAKGKYVSTIATDDIMMPDKTKIQVELLETSNEEVGAVYSDAYLIKEDGSSRYGWFIQRYRDFEALPDGMIYNELMQGNFIPAMSLMVKKSCYDDVGFFDEDLQFEDYDMWLRIARKYQIVFSNYISVKYRIRPGSLMTVIKWDASLINILAKHPAEEYGIRLMEKASYRAYKTNDKETLKALKKVKHLSPRLKRIYSLATWRIPFVMGYSFLRF